jgi:hypothetical protein
VAELGQAVVIFGGEGSLTVAHEVQGGHPPLSGLFFKYDN